MNGLELMNRLEILITYMNQQKKSEKTTDFSQLFPICLFCPPTGFLEKRESEVSLTWFDLCKCRLWVWVAVIRKVGRLAGAPWRSRHCFLEPLSCWHCRQILPLTGKVSDSKDFSHEECSGNLFFFFGGVSIWKLNGNWWSLRDPN